MKMVYGVKDRPRFPQLLLFALQQLLAILPELIVTGGFAEMDSAAQTDKPILQFAKLHRQDLMCHASGPLSVCYYSG